MPPIIGAGGVVEEDQDFQATFFYILTNQPKWIAFKLFEPILSK